MLLKLKHKLVIGMMKSLAGLAPGQSHLAFTGPGSSRELCQYLINQGYKKVLIASDKILRDLGVTDQGSQALLDAGLEVAYFDDIEPNPTFEQVEAGKQVLRAAGSEVILAIGGGSVIDCAKIMSAAATSDDDPRSWVGFGKVKHDVIPLYAISTTAGTGSEATAGAVITDVQNHAKVVISGASLLPKAAAVDPRLQQGLPPAITAAMAMAAYHAGMAINQVNVGNVHAIAHQFGAYYGVPHGLANAVVLPYVLEFSKGPAEAALAELADLVGVAQSGQSSAAKAQAFIDAVKALNT